MSINTSYKTTFITVVILLAASLTQFSCKKDKEKEVKNGSNSNGRTMQQELDFIESKAQSLQKNSLGYWEATFEDGVVMIYVPTGNYTMGNNAISQDDVDGNSPSPAHKVSLSHYWICKTPVTIGQFRSFVNATSHLTEVESSNHPGPFVYDFDVKGFVQKKCCYWDNAYKQVTDVHSQLTVTDDHPVSCVTWNDGIAYANWLFTKTGIPFTLPTEAEWERAARGTDQRTYPWGNDIPDGTRANYADEVFNQYFPGTEQAVVHNGVSDGFAITSPVLSFPAGISPIGAYDMAGNLIEWVYDAEYIYTAERAIDPINKSGDRKLQRGGFWVGSAGRIGVSPNEIKDGHNIRSDSREGDDANSADDHLGFRIAISYTDR
jgi:formylglycine-generating enzyme required for sulfatase activity